MYLLVNKDRDDKDKVGLVDVCYILSTLYGLVLIVFLMSYGMVAVPKSFWKQSNYKGRIKYFLYHISLIEEKLNDLRVDLSDILNGLNDLNVTTDLHDQFELIKSEVRFFKENNPQFDNE